MEWISVKERLPIEAKNVLIHNKDSLFGGVYVAVRWDDKRDASGYHWHSDFCGEIDSKDVAHWMPLPGPPKQ